MANEITDYDVIIIGGGPAGLTAGLYCSRYGLSSLLIERGLFGGQIINAGIVENYPGFPNGISGMELGQLMSDQALKYGLKTVTVEASNVKSQNGQFIVYTADGDFRCKVLIIAAGANYRKLEIDGEERLTGMGVSYCATCDGFLYRNKEVAVIGGGDTALTDAIELSSHCSKVYLIHRRDQWRACEINRRIVQSNPKIVPVWNTVVTKIEGDEKVNNLKLKNVKSGEISSLDISGVFIAVGVIPNSQVFKNIIKVDDNGNIQANENMGTSIPGIFVAGDIRINSAKQVASAVGDGATAAKAAYQYLKGYV